MVLLGQQFGAMKLKGQSVKLGVPASEAEMLEQFSHSHFIEPSLERDSLTQDVLKTALALQNFCKNHCHSSNYVYQLKKCRDQDCKEHPIGLHSEVFSKLSFLPLPLLDALNETLRKVYEQIPDERGRPTYVPVLSEEANKKDRSHRGTQREALEVERIKESKLYICGSPLFLDDSLLVSNVIVREAGTCASPIELQYYNSVLLNFPPICYFCGLGEEHLVNDDHIKNHTQSFVRVMASLLFVSSLLM